MNTLQFKEIGKEKFMLFLSEINKRTTHIQSHSMDEEIIVYSFKMPHNISLMDKIFAYIDYAQSQYFMRSYLIHA